MRLKGLRKMTAKQVKSAKALLLQKQNFTCCWCGHFLALDAATWEHIIPKKLGGDDSKANMALSHLRCNKERGHNIDQLVSRRYALAFVQDRIDAWKRNNQPTEAGGSHAD